MIHYSESGTWLSCGGYVKPGDKTTDKVEEVTCETCLNNMWGAAYGQQQIALRLMDDIAERLATVAK